MCMNPVISFFKKIDTIINTCVDYFDYRIRTGKFIDDIKYNNNLARDFLLQTGKKEYSKAAKSKYLFSLITILKALWQMLMKIQLFAITASFLWDTIRIVISCYGEIFIVFAFTFSTTILLLNWFQSLIVLFFIGLIPIFLLNIYCISALFYFIKHDNEGERISLWHSFQALIPRFSTFILPALVQTAIIQESLVGFIIAALFLSYTFELINISWEGSFIYWFIVLFIGFLIFIGVFILYIIMYQAYFFILLDNLSFQQAFKRSRTHFSTFLHFYIFFYFLLYLFFAFIIWQATITYLYLGITIGIYAVLLITTLLAYLIWKKFRLQQVPVVETPAKKTPILTIIIAFGFMNYILLAVFFVKEYQPFTSFVQQQEDNFLAGQEMKQYTNNSYSYTLEYPQAWTVYKWNNESTTFYNNYTGTISGGTWMTINVSSFNPAAFNPLFDAEPGLIIVVGAKDITTKVTNMSIQGNDTVNYTFVKSQTPYPQYETHFLIHKGTLMYDIAFISVTNDVANYNSDLFQKIISSFQFTQ